MQVNTRRTTGNAFKIERGFSLLEMSIVLVIIGIILGAVVIGRDVQRNAVYQRIATEFVQGWAIAYDTFATNNNIVVGDNPLNPTGKVNAADNTPSCRVALRTAMQAAGVRMPAGRSEGLETMAAYLDSNGSPQQAEVCFENVAWHEPAAVPGTYVIVRRNVLTLTGLTPSLARLLDSHFDNHADAAFGKFREQSQSAQAAPVSVVWSANEPTLDENQSVTLNAYLLMNR